MSQCQHASSAPFLLLILVVITQPLWATSLLDGEKATDIPVVASPEPAVRQEEAEEQALLENNLPGALTEEDDLFKDVDPKTLAAVLLGALNHPEKKDNLDEPEEKAGGIQEAQEGEDTQDMEKVLQGSDWDRDGQQKLELVMAAAKDKEEKEIEEERKREEKEEEQMTEKVTSHTSSQTIPVKELDAKEAANKPNPKEEKVEEEQLNAQEEKNLQSMLEELSYSTATKRDWDFDSQRKSKPYYQDFQDNEIQPKPKGYKLALSKKKLKWQEEQQKNRPLYRGGNFMDDFDAPVNSQDEQQEELLSPEEEEARAKAEQEEVRRQAAEAQRAKAAEEKLADIASDMLLQYMVKPEGKQNKGNNAAEDKRSDEEDNDEDDIDPQTIDKLIEISSKLHLPADDVVDIISDVEKKKKKDAPENVAWHKPLVTPPASAPAPLTPPQKQPTLPSKPSMVWLKDKVVTKPSKQDFWAKPQKQFLSYPAYPLYQKPYRGYYPIYFPPPKPKPRYYAKPALAFNDIMANPLDYDFDFSPKQRYRPWGQPRPRNQPVLQRNLYSSSYAFPDHWIFKSVAMPKPRSVPRRRPSFYYPRPAPIIPRNDDYYRGEQRPNANEDLENFIEKVFLKRPRMFQ